MNKDLILKYLNDGYNCSQTIFMYFSKNYNIDIQIAANISKAFESGMFNGDTCGAVSGAYMVLGLHFSDLSRNDLNNKINYFNSLFKEKMSHIKCEELLGININIENNMQKALDSGKIQSICPNAIFTSIEILEKMITN